MIANLQKGSLLKYGVLRNVAYLNSFQHGSPDSAPSLSVLAKVMYNITNEGFQLAADKERISLCDIDTFYDSQNPVLNAVCQESNLVASLFYFNFSSLTFPAEYKGEAMRIFAFS